MAMAAALRTGNAVRATAAQRGAATSARMRLVGGCDGRTEGVGGPAWPATSSQLRLDSTNNLNENTGVANGGTELVMVITLARPRTRPVTVTVASTLTVAVTVSVTVTVAKKVTVHMA